MHTFNASFGPFADNKKVSDSAPKKESAPQAVLNEILKTREARQALIAIVTELMAVWAENGKWKKSVSKAATQLVAKQLSKPEDAFEKEELAALFDNEALVKKIALTLAPVLPALLMALSKSAACLERLPVEEKKIVAQKLLSSLFCGQSGDLITHMSKWMADIQKTDPDLLVRSLTPGVVNWLESVDFGEVKEAVDSAVPCLLALVSMFNNAVWQYPSKVVGIFTLLPPLFKIAAGTVSITLKKINQLSPDLLTDIIISLLKEIDGGVMADLINQLMEIGRKILTGSALLGEPGSPKLPKALDRKLSEIVSNIDANVFWKGRLAFSHIKDSYDTALFEAMEKQAANVDLEMINRFEIANMALRAKNRKLKFLDEMEDQQLSEHLTELFFAYDIGEGTEYFNLMARLFNRFSEQNPKVAAEFQYELVNAIDEDELICALKNIFKNFNRDLRSVARSLLPNLIIWGCDILKAEDDEYEEDAAQAREALKSLLSA